MRAGPGIPTLHAIAAVKQAAREHDKEQGDLWQ